MQRNRAFCRMNALEDWNLYGGLSFTRKYCRGGRKGVAAALRTWQSKKQQQQVSEVCTLRQLVHIRSILQLASRRCCIITAQEPLHAGLSGHLSGPPQNQDFSPHGHKNNLLTHESYFQTILRPSGPTAEERQSIDQHTTRRAHHTH